MTEHKDNSKYIWGQFLFTKKKKKCYTERKENTQPQFILMQLCDPNPSIRWGREANEGGKEGQHAEGAHTVPMCQHSSFFITYLRVELGGWVRQTDRQRERGEQEMSGGRKKEGCWVDERAGERWCPTVLSALDHLYITIHWCVQLCERVRVFSYMSAIFSTKLQWDVTSVRRPSSCTLPTCVTKCGRERRDSVTSGVELLCRLDHLHVT